MLCIVALFTQHRDRIPAETVASSEEVAFLDTEGSAHGEARVRGGGERQRGVEAKGTVAAFHYIYFVEVIQACEMYEFNSTFSLLVEITCILKTLA